MQFRRSESVKRTDREWHSFRHAARKNAFSVNEFSDEEIVRFDLETARITGRDNPRTYLFNRAIDVFGSNGTDIRELRNR